MLYNNEVLLHSYSYFLCFRIHDVYNNRIVQVLSSMQLITLHTFPEDGSTWTAEEFLDKIDETCRQASLVCNQLVFI